MAFGQSAGPPATGSQMRELLGLVQAAGHTDFRDARGPLGLNQRQGGGRFTRDEATELIERLQFDGELSAVRDGEPLPERSPAPRLSPAEQALRRLPTERLAAELQRRGWVVLEPG
jgi:hypothetical protein